MTTSHSIELPSRFHLITQVWGASYCRLLTDVCIPGLLAPGNVPALASMWPVSLRIYTTEHDRAVIEQSPVFQRLSEIARAEFELIGSERTDDKYSAMTQIQQRALTSARDQNAAMVWVMPDTIWADGSLRTVGNLARMGKRAVMQAGIRVRKSEVLPAITARRSADGVIAFPPHELVRLALDHMHPYYRAWYWDAPSFNSNPANVYWRVDHSGLVARCFHLHPLMLFPQRPVSDFVSTFDDDLPLLACPDHESIYVVEDSDQVFHLDLADDDWCAEVLTLKRRPSSTYLAGWGLRSANMHHRRFVRHRIRIHATPLSSEWRQVERASDRVVRAAVLWMKLRCAASYPLEWLFGIDRGQLSEQAAAERVNWALLPPAPQWIGGLARVARALRLPVLVRQLEGAHRLAFRTALAAVFGDHVACRGLGIDPKLRKRQANRRRRDLKWRRRELKRRLRRALKRALKMALRKAPAATARAIRMQRRRILERAVVGRKRALRRLRNAKKRRQRLVRRLRKSTRVGFKRARRLRRRMIGGPH